MRGNGVTQADHTPRARLAVAAVSRVWTMQITNRNGHLPLIVFDCDGVLVDSERLLQRVDIAMLSDVGWPRRAAMEPSRLWA